LRNFSGGIRAGMERLLSGARIVDKHLAEIQPVPSEYLWEMGIW